MNCNIICNWNRRVSPGDLVFHVGDFCFKNSPGGKTGEGMPVKALDIEQQLNGRIIHIKGNHDRNNSVKTIVESITIKYGHHRINMVHDPARFDPRYLINFVGHMHEKWRFKRSYNATSGEYVDLINVGVDQWNFQPVTFEEIYKKYRKFAKHVTRKISQQ